MRSASSSILHRQKDDELNDDLLSTTLHELEQHCANKKENLEDLLNDISESVCPSTTTPQSDHNTQNNQRFQSCLDELSKPLIQSEVGHPSVASLESETLYNMKPDFQVVSFVVPFFRTPKHN